MANKQVRLDDGAYESLERISEMTGKPRSLCASLIVEMFEDVLRKLDASGRLYIESNTDRAEILLPLKVPRQKKRPD